MPFFADEFDRDFAVVSLAAHASAARGRLSSAVTEPVGRSLLASPLIHRLNLGAMPTSHVHWDQPHEGNLFDVLYRRRAVQTVA